MPRPKVKHMTNVEFVTHLMEYSKHGALMQIFVMDAIDKWSAIIAKTDPAKVDTAMMSGTAWVSVAKELQDRLANRFKEEN